MTRWAERERREGQVCREVYLSKEVVVQEKDASEAQEDTQHRASMPRFLRKPFSGEQGTRQGSITSPTHTHTDALKFGLRSERRGEG